MWEWSPKAKSVYISGQFGDLGDSELTQLKENCFLYPSFSYVQTTYDVSRLLRIVIFIKIYIHPSKGTDSVSTRISTPIMKQIEAKLNLLSEIWINHGPFPLNM